MFRRYYPPAKEKKYIFNSTEIISCFFIPQLERALKKINLHELQRKYDFPTSAYILTSTLQTVRADHFADTGTLEQRSPLPVILLRG